MERPAQRYFCNKCGYVGDVDLHSGCGYLAYHLAPFEQNYIDQLEGELALLKASPAGAPEGLTLDAIHAAWHGAGVDIAGGNWKRFVVMLAAAPTPTVSEDRKDAERFRDGWTHSCNALCMEIDLWIERCPHCGMPAPKAPAKQEDKP